MTSKQKQHLKLMTSEMQHRDMNICANCKNWHLQKSCPTPKRLRLLLTFANQTASVMYNAGISRRLQLCTKENRCNLKCISLSHFRHHRQMTSSNWYLTGIQELFSSKRSEPRALLFKFPIRKIAAFKGLDLLIHRIWSLQVMIRKDPVQCAIVLDRA